MKRVCAVILLAALVLFAGCQTPRNPNVLYDEPLSEKLKGEISDAFLEKYGFAFDWNSFKPCLGTINDYTVLIIRSESIDFEIYNNEVAGFTFTTAGNVYLYAYRDGNVCKLEKAYENGWLTKDHIGQLHAKYVEIEQNWEVYYQEWLDQKESHQNSSEANTLYQKELTEKEQETIRELILDKYGEIVRWGYVNPYYGTINNFSVVIVHPQKMADEEAWIQEIAEYIFEWDSPIGLYVYHHDRYNLSYVYTLQAAYENGLLTEKQIGEIYKRHNEYRADFPQMLEEWTQAQEDSPND